MDPYICPEALDRKNKYYPLKKRNFDLANQNYSLLSSVVNSNPVKVIVQTTESCNLSCIFCQYSKREKGKHMNKEIFENVVDQLFPTLVEMHPTNIGEPLMWPHFEYMCEKMEEYGVLLDLTTNGTLLKENKIDLIENIARDVKISFDGAHKETFESLRKGAKFDSVTENIKCLVQRIKSNPHRTISLQMTLMKSNYLELPDLIELASKLGVDKVKGYHLFSFSPEMDRESLLSYLDNYEQALNASIRKAKELGLDIELAEPPLKIGDEIDLKLITCHLPWYESWIDIDGSVYPCHSNDGMDIGNIQNNNFIEIWNGDFYREIRKAMAQDEPIWNCKGCGMLYEKKEEHQRVPYDPENFFCDDYRTANQSKSRVRWSGRMKQFELNRGGDS